MASIRLAAMAALLALGLPPAQAADFPAQPVFQPPPPPPAGELWIGAEYLYWSAKGDKLPALVTTSPPGTPQAQAGLLGLPATSVLFGDKNVNDGWRPGVRARGGYWFDPQHIQGLEAQFFFLGTSTTGYANSSGGTPILAQPFIDAVTGPNTLLVAFPGLVSGSIAISDSSRLYGAGAAYRRELCRSCGFGSISGLIGYRFMRLQENLAIDSTSTGLGNFAGLTVAAGDRFSTANNFHGLDLGLTGDVAQGPWLLTWLAKVAVGGTFANIDISGKSSVTPPGGVPVTFAGGFFAQPTNIGQFSNARLSVAPELGVNVGYQVTDRLRAFAGYSLLYWAGLVRPSGVLDTTINATQLGGGALVGPARPQPLASPADYWAQGLNVGLVFNY